MSHDAHAASAAAEAALMISGKPISLRDLRRLLRVGDRLFRAGHDRNSGFDREVPRGGLVAEQFEQLGAGPDERDPGRLAGAGRGRVLGEEAVPGMDRVHALLLRERDDAVDVEVRLDGPLALADQIRFVGLEAVQARRSSWGRSRRCADPSSVAARRMRIAISLRFSARSFFISHVFGNSCNNSLVSCLTTWRRHARDNLDQCVAWSRWRCSWPVARTGATGADSGRYKEDFAYNYTLKPGGRLYVKALTERVEVTGWDQDKVEIPGRSTRRRNRR